MELDCAATFVFSRPHQGSQHTSVELSALQRHESQPPILNQLTLAGIRFYLLFISESSRHPNFYCDPGSSECSLPLSSDSTQGLKSWGLEPGGVVFKFCFCHLLRYISLSKFHYFSKSWVFFLICKMGMIITLTSQGYSEDQERKCL